MRFDMYTIVKYELFTFVNFTVNMDYNRLHTDFDSIKDQTFYGRYLDLNQLQQSVLDLPKEFDIQQIGASVNHIPIYCAFWGSGKKKVLAWSLMHGNETTTTKALFDFVKFLDTEKDSDYVKQLSSKCKLGFIFVLNPDGAKAYTRVNANQVDLNRDALEASQPEMQALHKIYKEFTPDLCLNLHGQRTIFSAGIQPNSAVVSFLSPSVNETRSLTSTRKKSMQLIAEMNQLLQEYIPNQVGRYDDAYNPNCTGDYFQGMETPTILFEAGHFPGDYDREETRRLMFLSYIKVLESFVGNTYKTIDYKAYFEIPKNQKLFYDWIIRDAQIGNTTYDFAIQYEEKLVKSNIEFVPRLVQIDNLCHVFGHREEKLADKIISINQQIAEKKPKLNSVIEEFRTKNKVFSLINLKK